MLCLVSERLYLFGDLMHPVLVVCCCSSANKCLLKVAQFSAQRELFEKAAEIYEQVSFFCFIYL